MTQLARCSLLFVLVHALAPAATRADEGSLEPTAPRDRVMEHVRFEGTMGFVAGWSRHADLGLEGPLSPAAFQSGAAAGVPMAGLRYDVRLVVAFVRMTAGADVAWGLFDAGDTARTTTIGDAARALDDRSLFVWSLRLGLGLEVMPTDGVRLFADLLGVVRFVELRGSLDGGAVSHGAVSFAPALRVGARLRIVDAFFVQLAAEASPFGPSFGGELSVGGAIE